MAPPQRPSQVHSSDGPGRSRRLHPSARAEGTSAPLVHIWQSPKIRGTSFWGPYNKEPINYYFGYYIRVPHFRKLPHGVAGAALDPEASSEGLKLTMLFRFKLPCFAQRVSTCWEAGFRTSFSFVLRFFREGLGKRTQFTPRQDGRCENGEAQGPQSHLQASCGSCCDVGGRDISLTIISSVK